MRLRRKLYAIGAVALLLPAVALAAFLLSQFGRGVGGHFAGASGNVVTITADTSVGTALSAGGNGDGAFTAVNQNTVAEVLGGATGGTISASGTGCASHIGATVSQLNGKSVPPGTSTITAVNFWNADASTPTSCAGSTFTITGITGTTTP